MFVKKHLNWLIPIALLLAGCVIWRVPVTIFWEIALLAWFSTLPGMLLLSRVKLDLQMRERFILGTALGFGITPLCFMLLRMLDAWWYTSLVISLANVLALGYLSLKSGVWKERGIPEQIATSRSRRIVGDPKLEAPRNDSRLLALLSAVSVMLVVLYNFSGIHYAADGSLQMRGLFAIDVPFLIGIMPSFDLTGYLSDMHQNGLQYAYHDFTYLLIAVAKQVAGAEYFSLIAYSFPVFGMSVISIPLFALFRSFLGSKQAFSLAVLSVFLSSIWGDHVLTGALSPSYLAGIVLLIALLIVVHRVIRPIGPMRPIGLIGFIFVLLIILIKTKLPIYLVAGGSLGILGLIYLKRDRNIAQILILPCLLSLPMLLLFSEPNPYQPADDFVIGAPLMGYGNQLASLLNVSPEDVDPVITHHEHEWEDLLIIPFTIIHFLRMIVLDARLLLLVVVVLFFRKKIAPDFRWLLWLGTSAVLLGITLPILYSPAWYPIAISFYTPEIAAFIAVIAALAIITRSWDSASQLAKSAVIVCLLYGCISMLLHAIREQGAKSYAISAEEVRSLDWIKRNTPPDATLASNRYDLDLTDSTNDESFYLYGALSQRKVISSGAKYGGLLAAVADFDPIKGLHPVEEATTALTQRRMDVFTMYRSLNANLIVKTIDAYSVDYFLATRDPKTSQLDIPNANRQFETVYQSDELPVLRFNKELIVPSPKR